MKEEINEKDGWYYCKLKQVKKISKDDPDFIEDWVEFKNGKLLLHNYADSCEFVSIINSKK